MQPTSLARLTVYTSSTFRGRLLSKDRACPIATKCAEMETALEQLDLNPRPVEYDELVVRCLSDPEELRGRQLLLLADAAMEGFVQDTA
jgi:hypothetical protein